MMATLTWIAAGLSVALLAWLLCRVGRQAIQRHRDAFTAEARAQMDEMFLFIDPGQVWTMRLLLCVGVAGVAGWIGDSVALALLAGATSLAVPRWLSARWRCARLRRFDEQLPDTLSALGAALQAGSALPSALRVIVAETAAPLGQEFGLMLREQRLGVPFEQALANLHARMPSESVGLVVAVLRIAAQTGGNLADTLERIAVTLRARLHLQGRIQALTSQGRMQAWVVASLPPVLALILDQLEPEAMAMLWHTPMGWVVLITVAALEVLGVYLIRRIVTIDV